MDEKLSPGTLELYRYFSVKPPEEIRQSVYSKRLDDEVDLELISYLKTGKIPKSSIALYHVDIQLSMDDNCSQIFD